MIIEIVAVAAVTLLCSALLTGLVRRLALAHGVIDQPNERSSHVTPTPRGGGAAIVISVTLALVVLTFLRIVTLHQLLALVVGGGAVAWVGFLDDRRALRARVRLAVHFAAAIWAVYWLGGLPPLQFGTESYDIGVLGEVIAVLAIVWTLNLFNFMDGIDGLAGTEAVFVCWAGAALAIVAGIGGGVASAALILGAASLGFLLWNWPPAKIFMGDVGSGYIGYMVSVLALTASHERATALLVWLVLGGLFFVDATVTLACRTARGERLHEAHRSHAYQWLARRWDGHAKVTLLFLALNVAWLLPWAFVATLHPAWAAWIVLTALVPLGIGLTFAGAGREETRICR